MLDFFLRAPLSIAQSLAREHVSHLLTYNGLLDRLRECMPSDRARTAFDLLAVELALCWELQIDQDYIERANDVSPLIIKGLKKS